MEADINVHAGGNGKCAMNRKHAADSKVVHGGTSYGTHGGTYYKDGQVRGNAEMREPTSNADNKSTSTVHDMVNDSSAPKWTSIMQDIGLNRTPTELSREDLNGKHFASLADAEEFFFLYGRLIGFSVRKGHLRKHSDGTVIYRTWLCSKQGHREKKHITRNDRVREPKRISREGCPVQLRVAFSRKKQHWVVREFITSHSHAVALPCHISFLRAYRKISKGSQTKAKGMHRSGMKTSRILSYMAEIAGGYDRLGFWPKDLQNCIKQDDEATLSSPDAAAGIGYLQHKAEHDVGFFAKYSYDEEHRLMNLFWSDTKCQQAYREFGDTIAFDTTYKCNQYKTPVTIFVGVNHHRNTTIFGFAFIGDETVETYTWVLETFLECMRGKFPATIVTDGDLAMKSAISKVLVGTVHRLCSWHLIQNAISNVKDRSFLPWFKRMMKKKYDETTFDATWDAGIVRFGMQSNAWVTHMYERRKAWAESFLQGHFYAGMLTTQRCEGMHSFLKSKLDKNTNLVGFIRATDMALSWLRMMEGKHDFESREYRPTVGRTVLPAIEAVFAENYTQNMFNTVREQMNREGTYFATSVEEVDDTIMVKLIRYGDVNKCRKVSKSISTNTISCECNKFPSEGIPCRHIFASLKSLQITEIPDTLLLKRWMKNDKAGRENIGDNVYVGMCKFPCSDQSARFGHITARTTELAYYASLSAEIHNFAVGELDKLTSLVQGMTQTSKDRDQGQKEVDCRWAHIKNPVLKKTKGAPQTHGNKNLRVCSKCKRPGHNKATCRMNTSEKQTLDHSGKYACTADVDENEFSNYDNAQVNTSDFPVKGDIGGPNRTPCNAAEARGCSDADHSNWTSEHRPTPQLSREVSPPNSSLHANMPEEDAVFGGTPFGV